MLQRICRRLQPVLHRLVLVGGCATELLVTDPAAAQPRPTHDVDVIVQVASLADYYSLEAEIRALGFTQGQDDDGVLCRWSSEEGMVDIMPTDECILGFSNRWYTEALATATPITIGEGIEFNLITAACFIATKLEAFDSRGEQDYMASHDLEDVIAIVDGREELLPELMAAPDTIRHFVSNRMTQLLQTPGFNEAIPGLLPPDAASLARLPFVQQRLRDIANIG